MKLEGGHMFEENYESIMGQIELIIDEKFGKKK